MKVAVYVRVSSDRQAEKELSIPAQLKAIQQHCQNKGWMITQEFVEKGKSAKTDDRPEFQRMIAMAKRTSKNFEAILVHKFDRFSRNRDDHVIYKALLQKYGVKVISVTEQTEAETPQDMLLEGMLEVISEFFNANLAVEVRKGMNQNAKQGYNNGGTPPYGYRTEHLALGNQKTKAVWILGPREEINTVRFIFSQYAYENMGYKKIANLLNERNVPTQKGGQWSASTIRAIIHNESYIGRKIWNKQDYQTTGVKWRDRSEWVITENAHPAIINEELFNLCKQRSEGRYNGGGVTHNPYQIKPASPFWLRGIFTCDKCGSKMVGNSTASTKKYGGQKYYVCGGYMRKGKEYCSYVSWRKDHIERIVANKLRSALLRLTFDNQLEEEIHKYHGEANRHLKIQSANLEAEIGFLEKRINQMENELQSGGGKSYYAEMMKEMRDELEEKRAEHERLNELSPKMEIAPEYIQTMLNDIKQMISMLDDENPNPQMMNEYVRKFVSNVSIDRETKMIHIKVRIQNEERLMFDKTIVAEW